ncbi:MAG TPA: VWA domain-containing protein [Thermoanaerobaculia bacterium]|nr:VWA domain-containing protein [Thermoanaerobaculia bacterium]
MSGQLLRNALLFGRVLRGLGLEVGPDSSIELVAALEHVPVGRRTDFQNAARCVLVRHREDLRRFDQAFDAFWRKPRGESTSRDLAALGEKRKFRRSQFEPSAPDVGPDAEPGRKGPERGPLPTILRPTLTWSADEVLRHKDFADITGEELEAVRGLLREFSWRIAPAVSRRFDSRGRERLDLRRTLRRSLRHGGEVLSWDRNRRRQRPRPVVVIADVSGSMERYTRLLLLFLHGLARRRDRRVEAFLFGTRLTRVTRELAGADVDLALQEVARAVPDWSGGTRIGAALREFNFRWGRRVLSGGPVVLLISDGWDRGEPELLAREIARLQRSCRRLVWLNPLAGSVGYEPLARGMRAALPYVDDFLPVHSLASLEALARHLETLPEGRPPRRRAFRGEAA